MKSIISTLGLLLISMFAAFAQSANGVEMADLMRSSGKIYVVVAVVALILVSLLFYLFSLDKRVKKLEDKD